MSTLKGINSKSAKTSFDKKVLSAIQHLHPYVKHRLYIAESTGIIPKNMYTSNGIIDDSIIELYSNGFNIESEAMAVKLELFKLADANLTELFKKEAFHKNTVSTNSILTDELSKLDESFTMDADNDLILETELNDISYHQDNSTHLFLYDNSDATVLNALEIENLSAKQIPVAFGKLYSWLPFNVSNIVDLYAFGNLSYNEIAKVKRIETHRVELIMDRVKRSFRKNLN
ncbi:MAG: hypothetical protein HKP45_06165 [Winogradskyella sp.]|nr:hypothetical protein [Winogradskyella sp.]